jgi:hypothetical protein
VAGVAEEGGGSGDLLGYGRGHRSRLAIFANRDRVEACRRAT